MGLLKRAKRDRAAREPQTLEEYLTSGRPAPAAAQPQGLPPWVMQGQGGQFLPPPGLPAPPADYVAPEPPPPFPFLDAEEHRRRSYWEGAAPRLTMDQAMMEQMFTPSPPMGGSAPTGPQGFAGFAPPDGPPQPGLDFNAEWNAALERARGQMTAETRAMAGDIPGPGNPAIMQLFRRRHPQE